MLTFLVGAILLLLLVSLAFAVWPITLGILAVGGWLFVSYLAVLLGFAFGISTNGAIILGVCTLFAPVWYFNRDKS